MWLCQQRRSVTLVVQQPLSLQYNCPALIKGFVQYPGLATRPPPTNERSKLPLYGMGLHHKAFHWIVVDLGMPAGNGMAAGNVMTNRQRHGSRQ